MKLPATLPLQIQPVDRPIYRLESDPERFIQCAYPHEPGVFCPSCYLIATFRERKEVKP